MSAQRKFASGTEASPKTKTRHGPQLVGDDAVAQASPALALQSLLELELRDDRWPVRQRATFLLLSGAVAWTAIFISISAIAHGL